MRKRTASGVGALGLLVAAGRVGWRFPHDIEQAEARASAGSRVVDTRCGAIEVEEAGAGRCPCLPA